jgi:hypothetical protein
VRNENIPRYDGFIDDAVGESLCRAFGFRYRTSVQDGAFSERMPGLDTGTKPARHRSHMH